MFVEDVFDLAISHTSDSHPWFMASRNNRNTRFDDYYLWEYVQQREIADG